MQRTGAQRIGVHTGPLQQGQIYSGGMPLCFSTTFCDLTQQKMHSTLKSPATTTTWHVRLPGFLLCWPGSLELAAR